MNSTRDYLIIKSHNIKICLIQATKGEIKQTFFKKPFIGVFTDESQKVFIFCFSIYCSKMLKDCSIKTVYTQAFGFELICCLNKGQKFSGILKFLSSHILRCQVCNNQNDTQTMGSLQNVTLFSLVWMVSGKSFLFYESMKNPDVNLDDRLSNLLYLICTAEP